MKTIKFLSTILVIFFTVSLFGQEQPKKPIKKMSIQDIYFQTGMLSSPNTNVTLADFKTLAPQSVLLTNDFTNFAIQDRMGGTNNSSFSVMIGINFSDKQKTTYKTNPQLRLGFSFFSGSVLSTSLNNETQKPYDTLTSTQTGQVYYIDSLTRQNYKMDYSLNQLRFDASLIFRTNTEARCMLYTGIGFTAGISINANTNIYYDKMAKTVSNNDTFTFKDNINDNIQSNSKRDSENRIRESYNNNGSFGFSAYIPIGIDFRVGNKKELCKRTHLFYEIRPCINITTIPELSTITSASLQQGIGLRFSLN